MAKTKKTSRGRKGGVLRRRLPLRWVKVFFLVVLALGFVALGAGFVVIRSLSRDLPTPAQIENVRPPSKTLLFAAAGDTLHEFYLQNRVLIPLEDVPEGLTHAVISTEDRRFYDHYGVDLGGVARAVWVNMRTRRRTQGGSTLTQQLARSLFLTPTKRWERKIRETLLALQLERTYTKREILGMYLNTVYFGHGGAYGFEAAAQAFFGRSVRDLEPAEYTMLAGILPNPGLFSPINHLDRAYNRRAVVLAAMVRDGHLTPEEAETIGQTEVQINPAAARQKLAPYFVETIRQYLEQRYGPKQLYEDGLRVYTTLDSDFQRAAEEAFETHLSTVEIENEYEFNRAGFDTLHVDVDEKPTPEYLQGALVALDSRTGDILAMVGGRDFESSKFNRAMQAQRQPGSIFKPFLYTTALEQGFTTATVLLDAPVEVHDGAEELWRPVNFDRTFRGPVTMRHALANSINVPSVRLIFETEVEPVLALARRMGVESQLPHVYSIALGSGEANLLELVTAYTPFSNQGIRARPRFFTKIVDANGETLEETQVYQEEVLPDRVSYIVSDMLRTALREGTGRRARGMGWKKDSAGKTGTTDLNTDAWFIGYTPDVVCGVWVGFDKKVSMGRGKTGAVMALPIWANTMVAAMESRPQLTFEPPDGIAERLVCTESGELSSAACADVVREVFLEGFEPSSLCPVHRPGAATVEGGGSDFESLDEKAGTDEFGFGG